MKAEIQPSSSGLIRALFYSKAISMGGSGQIATETFPHQSKEEVLAGHAELIEGCEEECKNMPTATESLKVYAHRLLGDVSVTGYQPPLRVYIQSHLSYCPLP